ncbi:unnamed protein product [Polarella glacialis]|uniref:Uncharacterized protein n=1 Tax=Polarella glacialis TaxID=89957 RepID=A0A813GFK5_POLGL|nr:unnamed protein product [Polarella glacialis]
MAGELFWELLGYPTSLIVMQLLESRHHLVAQCISFGRAMYPATISASLRRRLNKDVNDPGFREALPDLIASIPELLAGGVSSSRTELVGTVLCNSAKACHDRRAEDLEKIAACRAQLSKISESILVPSAVSLPEQALRRDHLMALLKENTYYAIPTVDSSSQWEGWKRAVAIRHAGVMPVDGDDQAVSVEVAGRQCGITRSDPFDIVPHDCPVRPLMFDDLFIQDRVAKIHTFSISSSRRTFNMSALDEALDDLDMDMVDLAVVQDAIRLAMASGDAGCMIVPMGSSGLTVSAYQLACTLLEDAGLVCAGNLVPAAITTRTTVSQPLPYSVGSKWSLRGILQGMGWTFADNAREASVEARTFLRNGHLEFFRLLIDNADRCQVYEAHNSFSHRQSVTFYKVLAVAFSYEPADADSGVVLVPLGKNAGFYDKLLKHVNGGPSQYCCAYCADTKTAHPGGALDAVRSSGKCCWGKYDASHVMYYGSRIWRNSIWNIWRHSSSNANKSPEGHQRTVGIARVAAAVRSHMLRTSDDVYFADGVAAQKPSVGKDAAALHPRLPHKLMFAAPASQNPRIRRCLLEPSDALDEESLACLPPDFREEHVFRLQRCVLGTPLGVLPLSLRLGNAKDWRGEGSGGLAPLAVALPEGAWPWGNSSHRHVLAVWCGTDSALMPGFPSGPPVLKLPLANLTALDCQNGDLRLEFSFGGPAASCAVMRPQWLKRRFGVLLVLTFSDGSSKDGILSPGLLQASQFMQAIVLRARAAKGIPEIVPGLPNRGALVPSRWYCQATRHYAELLWALLNIAVLAQPLLRVWRLGLHGLGLDGVIRLLVSRPQTALQPITMLCQRLGRLAGVRYADLWRFFRPLPCHGCNRRRRE